MKFVSTLALALVAVVSIASSPAFGANPADKLPTEVSVGAAMHDVTGPTADVNFMGYAMMGQVGRGMHFRLRSRAFVVGAYTVDGNYSRFAFVSVDFGMGSSAVTEKVLEALEAEPTTKGLFTHQNLAISGTHTHSAPAGFLTHTIFQVTSLGFVKETFDAYVDGIAKSIIKANAKMKPSRAFLNVGDLKNANINRSPTAYLHNPAEERARYEANTDYGMTLLKFVDKQSEEPIGMVNWFAVHGTSMNNTNKLVSGDNKGMASYLFERRHNPKGTQTGKGDFVGAFAATNLGDVSPNINGTYCMDTGKPCDAVHSTCNGKNEMCVGRGPGSDMFESTRIIAERQDNFAEKLFQDATEELLGPVDARQSFISMPNHEFTLPDGTQVSTCEAAMGYSFAAGTTDGPGMFDFVQSTTSSNPFWNAVSHLISKPTKEQEACHHPKPILLNVGSVNEPYPWAASVVPIQVSRLGRLFLISVPSELTTMAGRRLREAVGNEVERLGLLEKGKKPVIVIVGLSNEYADYTTTYEEYQAQRYEGASTAYGPHELQLFIHEVNRLVGDMAAGRPSDTLPPPESYLDKQISLLPGVLFDTAGLGMKFGEVTQQPPATVEQGTRMSAIFRSANPRNNLRIEDTFLSVELMSKDGKSWTTVAVDGDIETQFRWSRPHKISSESNAEIVWDVPLDAALGTYRINHFNAHKSALGKITEFSGTTNTFQVVAPKQSTPLDETFFSSSMGNKHGGAVVAVGACAAAVMVAVAVGASIAGRRKRLKERARFGSASSATAFKNLEEAQENIAI